MEQSSNRVPGSAASVEQVEPAHTPGPWHFEPSRMRQASNQHWEAPVQVGNAKTAGNVIVLVLQGGPGGLWNHRGALAANARLIAAAPDLLAACLAAQKHLPSIDSLPRTTQTEVGNAAKLVNNAIASATGKSVAVAVDPVREVQQPNAAIPDCFKQLTREVIEIFTGTHNGAKSWKTYDMSSVDEPLKSTLIACRDFFAAAATSLSSPSKSPDHE